MKSKTGSTNTGHVDLLRNGTGDFWEPQIVIGDNDSVPDVGCAVTTTTYPLVILTVHDRGTVYTYQLNAEQIDVFLTNNQKKALIKKIKLAKMVERL